MIRNENLKRLKLKRFFVPFLLYMGHCLIFNTLTTTPSLLVLLMKNSSQKWDNCHELLLYSSYGGKIKKKNNIRSSIDTMMMFFREVRLKYLSPILSPKKKKNSP